MRRHPLWRPYKHPSDEEIVAVRVGTYLPVPIEVAPYDPAWPEQFSFVRKLIVGALGTTVVEVIHVGSTSVPGLAAKSVIDIDLIVVDSGHEGAYLPPLEAAGFQLVVREPDWEEHRMFTLSRPNTNLHVFSVGAVEPRRHRAFAEWLRQNPDDRRVYGDHKLEVATGGFTDAMRYNNAKSAFVYDLYEKIFTADPAHPHDTRLRPGC